MPALRRLKFPALLDAVEPGAPDWPRLFALRPPTESLNRWIKERLRDTRALRSALGESTSASCLALFNNLRAELAHQQRLKIAA